MSKFKKVVLAYSGGLDTSVIIPWLIENYDCEVVCFSADLGQGDDMKAVEKKAVDSGASKCYVSDLKEEFLRDYALRALRADAVYEHKYLLATSTARYVTAKEMARIALEENADALSHGATGKGNDQVRFELTFKAFAPGMKVIAPWREWDIRSREDAIEYAKKHNVPVPVTAEKPYSSDANLWHISWEGGVLEDPANEPKPDMFQMTVNPEEAPDQPEYVEIEFEQGWPVAVDGKKIKNYVDLVQQLNKIGGEHGCGRVDLVENRCVGMKSRGVYECPGAALLYAAHRELFFLTHDHEMLSFRQLVAQKYSEMAYAGRWFSHLREALDAFVDECEQRVTGKVRLKLYKGSIQVVGRTSPCSLYEENIATFGDSGAMYSHSDAEGFMNLYGLPIAVEARLKKKLEAEKS
jgi:argininosuccinate synthase